MVYKAVAHPYCLYIGYRNIIFKCSVPYAICLVRATCLAAVMANNCHCVTYYQVG